MTSAIMGSIVRRLLAAIARPSQHPRLPANAWKRRRDPRGSWTRVPRAGERP